jgi:hypothetical protein
MCLIVTGPCATLRTTLLETKGMIEDIFTTNPDGAGVMYASKKRGLRIIKTLPKSADDLRAMVAQLPQDERDVCLHLRMRTHGDVDLENCHPYTVAEGQVAMAHNGVLATGNSKDKTKSDTWHFIQDFLASTVAEFPGVVHSEGFLHMVEEFVDSNRFVFMDAAGRMSIVNEALGVKAAGLWFSNTYAWSPEMLIPGYVTKRAYYGTAGSWWDDEDGTFGSSYSSHGGSRAGRFGHQEERDFFEALHAAGAGDVAKVLTAWPYTATEALYRKFTPSLTKCMQAEGEVDKLSASEQSILEAALRGVQVESEVAQRPATAADVFCYYLDWTPTVSETEPVEIGEPPARKHYTYEGFDIIVSRETDGTWAYNVNDPEGEFAPGDLDDGYGFDEAEDALAWACQEIDRFIGGFDDDDDDAGVDDDELEHAVRQIEFGLVQ